MFIDRTKILAVYLACALLFGTVFLVEKFMGTQSMNVQKIFLNPLDRSISVLGSRSNFKNYLAGERVYAFVPYWNLDGRDLNVDAITDLSYFGLNVNSEGRIVTNDGSYKKWRESKDLSLVIKKVKKAGGNVSFTLICHNDSDIDVVLSCPDCWKSLAADVERELKWAGIKDINVDFENSGYTNAKNAENYTKLVEYLNDYLDKAFDSSFVVVSTYADAVDRAQEEEVRLTNPKGLAQVADAIFIMAYDFHRPTSLKAGPVSPLDGTYITTKLNLIKVLKSYLEVAPANKLILGLPFYGYDWVVEDTSPMSERIEGNDYIGYSKVITYAEVTDLLIDKHLTPQWSDAAKTPFVNYVDSDTGSLRQIYYDNEESLRYKTALARKNALLGVGIWALGYEGGYADLWNVFKPQP